MKGLFIPEITAEMFKNGCLESIEALMAEGQIYDIDYPLEQESVLNKIRTEIEQVKSIMNEEIIKHNRKDLVNFVNGLNQSLVIIDKYIAESEGER